ncbi:MAG TPA: hypothetical protein VGB20_00305 [bacterium]
MEGAMPLTRSTHRPVTRACRLIFLSTLMLCGSATVVFADSTGPNSPGTLADDSSNGGDVAWTSPGNAASSNDSYATAALNTDIAPSSTYIKATNFGFSIPAGSTIDGIVAGVERKVSGAGTVSDGAVRIVKGGTIGSTDRATATTYPSSDTYEDHGGSTDLWGETWTVSDINASDFGVAFSSIATTGIDTVSVDHIRITVHYTPATVSGRIYTDEGSTALNCSTSRTVALSVNGAAPTTVECSNSPANGSYEFTGVTVSEGQTLTVFLQDETENATTVTRAPASGGVTGLDLYQDRLIVRHEDAGPITNADLGKYDNDDDTGSDLGFTSNLATTYDLSVADNWKLIVWTGDTFQPGGNAGTSTSTSAASTDGDILIQSGATFSIQDFDLDVGGDFVNAGTFTAGTSQLTTFDADATGHIIDPGSTHTFDDVEIDGVNGGWSIANNTWTIGDDLEVQRGTLDNSNGTANLIVRNNFECRTGACGTVNFTDSNHTMTMGANPDSAFGTNQAVATNWTFNHLTFESVSGARTITTNGTGTGQIIVNGNLTLQTNGGTSLILDNETNDRVFDVAGDVTIGANTTFQASSTAAFTVGGTWDTLTGGVFTAGTGTVTFDSDDAGEEIGRFIDGANAFHKVVFADPSGNDAIWLIRNPMEVTSTDADAMDLRAGTVTVGDSNGDGLIVHGGIEIAATPGETATLQSQQTIPQGQSVTIDINDNNAGSPPSCANCIVKVGAASGAGTGTLDIGKNAILRLNPRSAATASDTGIEVDATGFLEIQGSQDDTGTLTATDTLALRETTLCAAVDFRNPDENNGKHVRITNTDSLAFGRLYDITDTILDDTNCATDTHDSLVIDDASYPTDANPDVKDATACSGDTTCTVYVYDGYITSAGEGVGRYLHNLTDDQYYQIVGGALKSGAEEIHVISNAPDDFTTMDDGDDVEITDGIRAGDTFEVLDYAHVTAEAGTACSAAINETGDSAGEAYIYAKADSEVLIRYADLCNLGRNDATNGNAYGVVAKSINGNDTDEGLTLEKSRFSTSFRGLSADQISNASSANSQGVSDNLFSGMSGSDARAVAITNSSNILVTANRVFGNTGANAADIDLAGTDGSTISWNVIDGEADTTVCLRLGDGTSPYDSNDDNIILANTVTGGTSAAIQVEGRRNVLRSNTTFYNAGNILVRGHHNFLHGNTTRNGTGTGVSVNNDGVTSSGSNIVMSHTSYAHAQNGASNDANSNENVWVDVHSYANASGVSGAAVPTTIIASTFGSPVANSSQDFTGGASNRKVFMFDTVLASGAEVSSSTPVLSRKHDGTAGNARLWNDFTVSSNSTETPNDEGRWQFNYADALWADSVTPHGFYGAGRETSLGFSFNGSMGGDESVYAYRVVCNNVSGCVGGGSNDWDVYRYNSSGETLLTAKASTDVQYTDSQNDGGSAPNVRFTVDDSGSPDYVQGDTYTFVAFKTSGDTSIQKTLMLMQDTDSITVGSGETLEFKGQDGSETQVTRGGGSGGYAITVQSGGALDVDEAAFDYLGGTGQSIGIDLESGATLTALADADFDNFAVDVGSSDSYIRIHNSIIDAGPRSLSGLTFDNTTGFANYNITNTGTDPDTCGDTWLIQSAGTIGGAANGEDYDSDTGDGGGCNFGFGYLFWGNLPSGTDTSHTFFLID